jgi:hypothetical protein
MTDEDEAAPEPRRIEGAMSGSEFLQMLRSEAEAGRPIMLISNGVDGNGNLSPEAAALFDELEGSDPAAVAGDVRP